MSEPEASSSSCTREELVSCSSSELSDDASDSSSSCSVPLRGQASGTVSNACNPNVIPSNIRFHQRRGRNIDLLLDGRVAHRRTSFADSLVFSERAIRPHELFLVQITQNEHGWSGHMRIGLTNFNPNTPAVALPTFALPDLSNVARSWVVPVARDTPPFNNYVQHLATEPGTDGPSLPTDEGSCVGIYYVLRQTTDEGEEGDLDTEEGHTEPVPLADMHIVVNNRDLGAVLTDVACDRALYAVVDVYGTTKRVNTVNAGCTPPNLRWLCRNSILRRVHSVNELSLLPVPTKVISYLASDQAYLFQ